jgi:hypothetical protein
MLKCIVVAYPTCIAGGDCAGVVLCGVGLCTDSACWLLGFAEFGMVTISLTVIVLGCWVPRIVFFNVTEVVVYGK